jgi:acetyltransferase-like isoleucine patch superfamily enzyme
MNGLAALLALPALVSFAIRRQFMGADRALQGSSQALSLVPGLPGQYLRRAFFRRTLAEFHGSAVIEMGALISKSQSRIGENVYIGPRCHLGLVEIEQDVLLAAGVHIPSGPMGHGTADLDKPIRDQPGQLERIKVGAGAWIGSSAVVMADVGHDAVVGAGAVVTKPVAARTVVGGVPARVLGSREDDSGSFQPESPTFDG